MKSIHVICAGVCALILLWTIPVAAYDTAPRISDKEIVERLTRLEEGQKALFRELDKRFESIDKRFEAIDRGFSEFQALVCYRNHCLICMYCGCNDWFCHEEDLSLKQIKEMVEQAISKDSGEYIMTVAEKLRSEGKLEGKLEGIKEAIELGITLKFPEDINKVMARVQQSDDLDTLVKIKEAVKTAKDSSEVLALIA